MHVFICLGVGVCASWITLFRRSATSFIQFSNWRGAESRQGEAENNECSRCLTSPVIEIGLGFLPGFGSFPLVRIEVLPLQAVNLAPKVYVEEDS